MKHKRFSDEQVIGVPEEHETGAKVDDIRRRHAISGATFHTWREKYGGMEAATPSVRASSRRRTRSSSGSSRTRCSTCRR